MAKTKAIWETCRGEAHSNSYIDNCGVCMPYWGEIPACPTHKNKLPHSGWCKGCRKFYDMKRGIADVLDNSANFKE